MTNAVLILMVFFLFVYGFRLMARLDRILSRGGKESLCHPERAGKRGVFALYFSGESLRTLSRRLFRKRGKENGLIGAEAYRQR